MKVSTGLTFEAINLRALITVPSSSTTAVAWPLLDENPLDAVGFDVIDAVVRHHVRQVVAERVRRAAAELRIDAPGDHRGNQIAGLRRVKLVAAHDAEKTDEGAHARMLEMAENEFLRRGVEIF